MNERYDFSKFSKVKITGADISSLSDKNLGVLYTLARYCQAMADADIETMRELNSIDKVFTHMSGRQQTREEYFSDIIKGNLEYFFITIENPEIKVSGNTAQISCTTILDANAYGAKGVFRILSNHKYENHGDIWINVN